MIKTVREFLDFSGPDNKKKFIASIWLGVIEAFANALKIPAIMYILIGLVGGSDIRCYIIGSLLMMIVSIAVSIFAKKKSSLLQTEAGYGCCAFKRIEMAEHLRFVPMGYFANSPTGEVTSVITNTMDSLSNVATRVIMVSTQGILETLLVLIFLFFFDVRIGLIGAAGTILYLLVNTRLQNAGSESSERKNICDRKMAGQIVEDLNGISEIRNYGLAGPAAERFDRANEDCRKANTDMELRYDPWLFVQGCVLRLTGAAIVAAAVNFYLNGSMDLIIAIGMTICAFILFSGLEMYGGFSSLLHLIQGYMKQANEVLSLPTRH